MAPHFVAVAKGMKNIAKMHVESAGKEPKPVVRTVPRKVRLTAYASVATMLLLLFRRCCNRRLVVKLFQWRVFGRFPIRDLVFIQVLNNKMMYFAYLQEQYIILPKLRFRMEPERWYYELGVPSVYIKDIHQEYRFVGPLNGDIVDRLVERTVVFVYRPNDFNSQQQILLSQIDNYEEEFVKDILLRGEVDSETFVIGTGVRLGSDGLGEYATLVHHLLPLAHFAFRWQSYMNVSERPLSAN